MDKNALVDKGIPCWYCECEMTAQIFTTCFGETLEFYECDKCHFTLPKDFIEKNGSVNPNSVRSTP